MFGAIAIVLTVGILVLFITTAILQWLWNITMPDVFNLKEIEFWQSFRLIIISAILFGPGLLSFTGKL